MEKNFIVSYVRVIVATAAVVVLLLLCTSSSGHDTLADAHAHAHAHAWTKKGRGLAAGATRIVMMKDGRAIIPTKNNYHHHTIILNQLRGGDIIHVRKHLQQ